MLLLLLVGDVVAIILFLAVAFMLLKRFFAIVELKVVVGVKDVDDMFAERVAEFKDDIDDMVRFLVVDLAAAPATAAVPAVDC